MKVYSLNAKNINKDIYSGHLKLGGINPSGDKIGFTNYYMELNGSPYFAICGEFHYSRYDASLWEQEILKMKLGGINTVASYIIWNHHEEEEGSFNWEGNRDLRRFIELCAKHKMYFILRVGPFSHGEVRNGGIPDWMYGRPFEVRSNDEGYLKYAKRFYLEIGKQVKGLMFKDGGPIIAVQLENEFQSAGAPWETTPPQVLEWVDSKGGEEHMRILKNMALEAGLDAPIYTCTGWGGSPILEDEVLPLYGGYAFWPWIFYGDVIEHPATREYLFQYFHNNKQNNEDFNPPYDKERYPFACCEIGGGMQVWYNYRFIVPPVSVEAMPFVKVAGGCNFIGYYMYHGGSNPVGKHSYLNERTTPKISYDFQAPLGEFGQVRESYKRLKLLHYFFKDYEKELCNMASVLPENYKEIFPTDTENLRFAVRINNNSGFLFLSNYQDHVEMKEHTDFQIEVSLDDEELIIPQRSGMNLKKDVCCILPFNMKLSNITLKYSTTQFITKIEHEGAYYYFFFIPEGMEGQYCFKNGGIKEIKSSNGSVNEEGTCVFVDVNNSESSLIEIIDDNDEKIILYTLTRDQSLEFWKTDLWGRERILLSDADIIVTDEGIDLRSTEKNNLYLSIFPPVKAELKVQGGSLQEIERGSLFENLTIYLDIKKTSLNVEKISDSKAVINFTKDSFEEIKEVLLKIDYTGDVGYAYINGKLINDNFCNGSTWEIGLKKFEKELLEKGMYIYISPVKKGGIVKRDSAMAAVKEIGGQEIAEIKSIEAVSESSVVISRKQLYNIMA